MRLVNDHLAVKVRLTEPSDNGFLVLSGEVGRWAGPFPVTFRGALRPPGE